MLLATASPARADDAAEAAYHEQRAVRHYQAQEWSQALQEYFRAQRLAPTPARTFAIARCFHQLADGAGGRGHANAFLAYSEFLATAGEAEEYADARSRTERYLDQLRPRVAPIRAESDPPGARLYIDDQAQGSYGTSDRLLAVPAADAGPHTIIFVLDGYRTARVAVEARAGEEVVARAQLERIVGTLAIDAAAGARVRVRDAQGRLAVPEADAPFRAELPPGFYSVAVEREGFQPASVQVSVQADESITRRVDLEPVPPPTGRITVASNVSASRVLLDGERMGFAPLEFSASAGEHVLRVEADDRRPWEGRIDLSPEAAAYATVTLEEQDQGQHSPATWILGATGILVSAAAVVLAIFAFDTHQRWQGATGDGGMPDANLANELQERGAILNPVTDVVGAIGAVTLLTAVVLFLVEEGNPPRQSRVNVDTRTLGEE